MYWSIMIGLVILCFDPWIREWSKNEWDMLCCDVMLHNKVVEWRELCLPWIHELQIRHVYTLESVSNVYRRFFGELRNEAYWPSCHKPMICPNLDKKINSKGNFVSSHIHTKTNIQEPDQSKRCSMCRISSHSKKNYPYHVNSSQQR